MNPQEHQDQETSRVQSIWAPKNEFARVVLEGKHGGPPNLQQSRVRHQHHMYRMVLSGYTPLWGESIFQKSIDFDDFCWIWPVTLSLVIFDQSTNHLKLPARIGGSHQQHEPFQLPQHLHDWDAIPNLGPDLKFRHDRVTFVVNNHIRGNRLDVFLFPARIWPAPHYPNQLSSQMSTG